MDIDKKKYIGRLLKKYYKSLVADLLPEKTKLAAHHMDYDSDYTVELQQWMHESLKIVQATKPTSVRLTLLENYIRSLNWEKERYNRALDMGIDNRVVKLRDEEEKKMKHTIEELEEFIERQKYIDKEYGPILVDEKARKLFLEHGQDVIEHLEKQIAKLRDEKEK